MMIIAIDFDGTIVENQFPHIGKLIANAVDALRALKADGHTIIINTCRSGDNAIDAVNFLVKSGIPFDVFNDNDSEHVAKYNNNCRKIYAHVYVDDRQVGGLPPWPVICDYIYKIDREYKERSGIKKD